MVWKYSTAFFECGTYNRLHKTTHLMRWAKSKKQALVELLGSGASLFCCLFLLVHNRRHVNLSYLVRIWCHLYSSNNKSLIQQNTSPIAHPTEVTSKGRNSNFPNILTGQNSSTKMINKIITTRGKSSSFMR